MSWNLDPDGPMFFPFSTTVESAIADVYAGITVDYAARHRGCTIDALTAALATPEARFVHARSEWTTGDLVDAEFADRPDLVPGIVPVGLTLLGAAPKTGKTRMLTQLFTTAPRGGQVFGHGVAQTSALFLALEDGARRIRKAVMSYAPGVDWRRQRHHLEIRTTSLRLNEGGLAAIEDHLDQRPECRLVGIDVLQRVRPKGRGGNAYEMDYEALAPLQRMANLRGIGVVVVTHSNQRADVGDVFEKISGTSGLTGVADSMLLLHRRNGDTVGTLSVSGREVGSQTIALGFEDGWWVEAPQGMPVAVLKETAEIRRLWLWLADNDGASTAELAKEYGRTPDATLKILRRLETGELIDSLGSPAKGRPVCWQVVRERP